MIVTQNTKLNVVPGGIIPVVHVSQYDVDRAISFTLYDGNGAAVLDNGTTVSIEGTKPDGHGFQYAGTLTGNVASFNTTQQMTVLVGAIECKLTLRKDSQVIGTAMFILDVEKAGINEGTDISDTDLPMIISLATEQMENAEAWAVGTKNGEPVTPADPQYNNDAKHWAEEAAAAVSGVAGVKGNAEEEYRHGNVNLTPEDLGAVSWQQQNVLGAKNLCPFEGITQTVDGITWTINTDNTITVNGTNTASTSISSYAHKLSTPKGQYILSGSVSNIVIYLLAYNGDTYVDNIGHCQNGEEKEVTIDFNGYDSVKYQVFSLANIIYSNAKVSPMLRLASIADNTYVPYAMTNRELTEGLQNTILNTLQYKGVLTASDNLNSIEQGIYLVQGASVANRPSDISGYWHIFNIQMGFYQQFILASNAMYFRYYGGSSVGWTSWIKVTGTVMS